MSAQEFYALKCLPLVKILVVTGVNLPPRTLFVSIIIILYLYIYGIIWTIGLSNLDTIMFYSHILKVLIF